MFLQLHANPSCRKIKKYKKEKKRSLITSTPFSKFPLYRIHLDASLVHDIAIQVRRVVLKLPTL